VSRWKAAVAVAAVSLLACSCQEVLTADGSAYTATFSGTTLTVTNTGASGVNEREAEIPSSEPVEAASTSCATWTSGTSPAQNGILFRGGSATGGWNGVELERSFYGSTTPYGKFGIVYFHGGTISFGPYVDLSAYFAGAPVWPMSICASITSANVFSFAVAKAGATVPALGTPGQGATWTLDATQMPASGQTGTYVAHIPTGTSLIIDGTTIDGTPAPSPLS
jgi:hypothetical protein